MDTKRLSESRIRTGVGLVLWAISSLLTAGLFLGFAGDDAVKRGIMLGLAIGLEGAKILSWRLGGPYRVLAVSLIALSATASLGAALETVEGIREQAGATTSSPDAISAADADITNIDRQISILIDRLAALPSDYTSAVRQLNGDLEQLRSRRSEAIAQAEHQAVTQASRTKTQTMFDLIATALRVPAETVMLVILLFMAANLEIAALVLAGRGPRELSANVNGTALQDDQASAKGALSFRQFTPQVTTERFLEAAMLDADLPYIHGRETTAKHLGIRSYEAKVHVRKLIKTGQVIVVGKRLALNGYHRPESEKSKEA